MKKTFKIFLISVFALVLLSLCNISEANSIESISMNILIDALGNAHVAETWKCTANSGTEVYHPYYNLGNSKITNLSVTNGEKKFEYISSWKVSGDFDDKAYKCGFNKIEDGVELCWGISDYGENTYTVSYIIKDFVATLNDSQMVYWTLIPHNLSDSVGQVYIKISSYYNIPDTTPVWGYGNYGGTAYVYDGYIEMQSDGRLDSDEYMTILVKFPINTFDTSNVINKDFDYYYNMAQEGATVYKNTSSSELFEAIIALISFGALFLIVFKIGTIGNIQNTKLPKTKDIPYYRDIPCDGDIFKAYYIAHLYHLSANKTDLLGAIILKWLKNSWITIEQKQESTVFKPGAIFKKEDTIIVLKETDTSLIKNSKEKELFEMLYQASKDGYLESNEFERWCSHSYERILDWFDDIISTEKQDAMDNNLLIKDNVKTLGIFSVSATTTTPELTEKAMELAGLKRYLNEYTLIHEREPMAVTLFEDYLIFAQIFGIAKKVAKDFKDIYPEVIEQSTYTSYDNIVFVHTCSSHGISRANSAKQRAESYSSGGGGFSSGGGGGGSFGGGGGGGGFR